MPTPAQTRIAIETADALETAPRGKGTALVEAAAERAGCSPQTMWTWMRPYRTCQRKRRADYVERTSAAELALTRNEALTLSAAMLESTRETGRQTMSLRKAVRTLRADGHVLAARVDQETGELGAALSESAISRALTRYGCHPGQLARPTPHQPKRTLHPNHEWQIDASVCVVYYLPSGGTLIRELDPAVHYKNKPENLRAIERFRVIRFVLTDHTSGVVRWRYYPHSETGAHYVAMLAWAMSPKADPLADPFQGAPTQILVDPGAGESGTVRRFCARCGIRLMVTQPRNPRAKGSVEKGNDLVETTFESGLRFQRHRISDFEALNALADVGQVHWNATAIHTRHGMTRFAAWALIRPEQLRLTEGEAALRALATEHPAQPKVLGDLTVAYKHGDITHWHVDHVPGACIGDRLPVLWSPLIGADGQGQAVAVVVDPETGREVYHPLRAVRRDEWGQDASAPVSGEEFKSKPETDLDRMRKRVRQRASGTDGHEADIAARKAKDFRPLADLADGRGFNPYAEAETSEPVTWLPKRGTPHPVTGPQVEVALLDHTAAALRIAPRVRASGGTWGPDQYAWLVRRHPDGVPEDAIQALVEALTAPAEAQPKTRAGLSVVR